MKKGVAMSLPKSWGVKKLSEVCERFIVPQRDKPKEFNGTVPWCRIEDFDGRYLYKSKSDKCVTEELIQSMPLRVFPVNTVIVSCSADLGRCAIIKEPLVTNQTFIGLVPKDEIYPEYLYYLMGSMAEYLNKIATGATIKYLSKKKFQNLEAPIPQLSEQKQIVATLDEAFAAIDKAQANIEKNIENAAALFQSKLNEIFSQEGDGWEKKNLNEICEVKDGTHNSPKYVDEKDGIPFVTQKNILDEGLSFESAKFISESDHEGFYKRSNVAYQDILFAMIGANRGMACIVDDKRTFSIKNVGLIKSNENYSPKYLLYYLKSPLAKKYVDENSSGSAQGFIGLGKLRAFPIPYTDIEMQRKIESQIESLNEFIISTVSAYNQKLTNLEDLKKSILQKAFSGELTSAGSVPRQNPVSV